MSPAAENPYPGLRPFEAGQAHLFFGRDEQIDELVGRLSRHRFVAVVGSSGSGKSSLVRAGVLPALEGGFLAAAGSAWRIAVLRPGNAPLEALAAALGQPAVLGENSFTAASLRRGPLGLIEAARLAGLGADNLLVVVDQFEELFRFGGRDGAAKPADAARDERAAFVRLLLEAAHQTAVPIYVVLTLRSDYIGDCARYPELAAAISASQFLVPRLTREQLKAAIEGPAAVGGTTVAPRLLQRLLGDVGEDSDQLPILQHALMRTWERWTATGAHGPLDLVHYEATGGTREALSRHADEAWEELDEPGKVLAKRLFRALTEKNEDQRGVRRPTSVGEVAAAAAVTAAAVAAVVEVFRRPGRSFLMPPAGTPLAAATMLDISHESLMRVWQRLREWVDQEGMAANRWRRLTDSARLWQAGEVSLLRDPELAAANAFWNEEQPTAAWAGRYGGDFAATTRFFERSRQRARWIARIQFLAVPLAVTLLLAYTLWRAERRSQAQQAEIAQLEDQKIKLELRVGTASATHDQQLDEIERLRRERAGLVGLVDQQKKANSALVEANARQAAHNQELTARAEELRRRDAELAAALQALRERAPRLRALLTAAQQSRECLAGRLATVERGNESLRATARRLGVRTSFEAAAMTGPDGDPSNGGPTFMPSQPSNTDPENLRHEVAELEELLRRLEAAAPATEAELEELRQAKALLAAALAELQRRGAELTAEEARLQEEGGRLEEEVRGLSAAVARKQLEQQRLVAQTAGQEKELQELKGETDGLRRRLERAERQLHYLGEATGAELAARYAARAVDPQLDPGAAAALALLAFAESPNPEDGWLVLLLSTALQRLDPAAAAATTREVLGDPERQARLDPEQLAAALCRSRPRIAAPEVWERAAGGVASFDPSTADPCARLAARRDRLAAPEEPACPEIEP